MAVLGHPHRLVGGDALPTSDPLQDVGHLVGPVGRHEQGNRLAPHLARRVPVEPLRSRVPARDRPLEALREDRVLRRIHDGGDPRESLLRPPAPDHGGGDGEGRDPDDAHEGLEQEERFVGRPPDERAVAPQGAPDRDPRDQRGRGGGLAGVEAESRPEDEGQTEEFQGRVLHPGR